MTTDPIITVTSDQSTTEFSEITKLVDSIKNVPMPGELKEKSLAMVDRLRKLIQYGSFSHEYEPVEKYISWITQIPWGKYSQDILDLENVRKNLDATHYGLNEVKELILEYVSMLHLLKQREEEAGKAVPVAPVVPIAQPTVTPTDEQVVTPEVYQPALDAQVKSVTSEMSKLQGSSSHAPIICFVGVQGIGKTSIAKSIGNAMGKQFIRISLGGLGNASELRGTPRGIVDAGPGQIIKALIRAGTMNPLILVDEVDKVSDSNGTRSDVMASLLEILDPEQNSTFLDHYIDYPIDLSKVMFIATANNLGGISAALLDRLEIIRMTSYTDEEKKYIAKDYLLPKVLIATGVDPSALHFNEDVWELVIRPLGFDAGIRQLERNLTTLARKIAKMIVTGQGKEFTITRENFREFIPSDFGIYS